MRGYSADHVFRPDAQRLRDCAERNLEKVLDRGYRCHEVTRAFFRWIIDEGQLRRHFSDALVLDGTFAGADHSWIQLDRNTILDVYAVGRLPMVQLIDVGTPTLMRNLFRVEPPRTDIREDAIKELLDALRT